MTYYPPWLAVGACPVETSHSPHSWQQMPQSHSHAPASLVMCPGVYPLGARMPGWWTHEHIVPANEDHIIRGEN